MKWLDLNRDGKVDSADLLIGLVRLCAGTIGVVLMFSTWARSFHLLSSPQMNPGVFALWPWITSLAPEAGFLLAYFAMHAGIRKGYLTGVILGIIGMGLFGLVIGTMQWYDVELVRGADLGTAGQWADYVATFIALITIGYAAVVTAVIEYINIDSVVQDRHIRSSRQPVMSMDDRSQLRLPSNDNMREAQLIDPPSRKGDGAGTGHPQLQSPMRR